MPTPRYRTETPAPGDHAAHRAHGSTSRAFNSIETDIRALEDARLAVTSAPAFVSNDCAIPASPPHDAVYDVPTTGAASTVTLPTIADEGTRIYVTADGVKNGHTVQYRDAAAVNLTTALAASKRHLVVAVFLGSKWRASAYASP